MATNLENLKTIRQQIIERLVEITANPKPSYNIEGQSVSWDQHLATLRDSLKMYDELIADQEGPVEFHTEGFT